MQGGAAPRRHHALSIASTMPRVLHEDVVQMLRWLGLAEPHDPGKSTHLLEQPCDDRQVRASARSGRGTPRRGRGSRARYAHPPRALAHQRSRSMSMSSSVITRHAVSTAISSRASRMRRISLRCARKSRERRAGGGARPRAGLRCAAAAAPAASASSRSRAHPRSWPLRAPFRPGGRRAGSPWRTWS